MSRQKKNKRLNSQDFYPTPAWCYENLEIDWTQFSTAHEPCAGDHRIVDFLQDVGITTTHTDILEGTNFLEWNQPTELILTNPPFQLAQEFIDHSVVLADTVIMLLRLNFLGSISRHDWWKTCSPTALHVLSKRPSFTGGGSDATEYAWFVWDKTDKIPHGISFVAPPTENQRTRDNRACKIALECVIEELESTETVFELDSLLANCSKD